jgi:hypothetical protein
MKQTEKILIVLSIVFLILNIFFIFPGGNMLFILTIMLLTFIYFFLGFALFNNIKFRKIIKKESYVNISSLKTLGAVSAGISLSITAIGILFKVMFWPGSYTNLKFGIISLIIITIISLVKNFKSKSDFYNKILKRSILFAGIAIILIFISNQDLAEIKYRNEPEYAKALINVMNNPDNKEYQSKFQEEHKKREMN